MDRFCPVCCIGLHCLKNGVVAVAMGKDGPVEARHADLYICPDCEQVSVHGYAPRAIAITDRASFVADLERDVEAGRVVVPFWTTHRERAEFDAVPHSDLPVELRDGHFASVTLPRLRSEWRAQNAAMRERLREGIPSHTSQAEPGEGMLPDGEPRGSVVDDAAGDVGLACGNE